METLINFITDSLPELYYIMAFGAFVGVFLFIIRRKEIYKQINDSVYSNEKQKHINLCRGHEVESFESNEDNIIFMDC